MFRLSLLLLVLIVVGCLSKSQDEIIDFKGVSPIEGVKYLNEQEKRSKDNPDIYYKRAALYFELGQYDKASIDVNKLLEIEETNADYVYLAGRIDQKLNRSEKAIEYLLLAEGLGLHNHLLYQTLAEEYLKLGKPEEAKLAIERLIGLNKSSSNYTLAGRISLNLGDTLNAIKYFQESLLVEENNSSLMALHHLYMSKGQVALAGNYINRALKVEPHNINNLRQKGSLLTQVDFLDSAKQVYSQVLELDSSQSVHYYDLGLIHYNLFEYDTSQVITLKALALEEGFIDARLLLARTYDKLLQYSEAIGAYEMILAQDSTFNLARVELDNLQRKVAYLRRINEQRRAIDSARNNAPVLINRKGIDN